LSDRFTIEREQILSQFILHHEVSDEELARMTERLDRVIALADELHTGQTRKTGEEYVYHPIRTAMEVSRFGRIVDWATIEAAILHDIVEDTDLTVEDLRKDYPDAADLVDALTKFEDSPELTYQKLLRFVLQDIRVLLVKLADRLDNLDSLYVFKREKQLRIANESASMYMNICKRLCMGDLAERFSEKIGSYLDPDASVRFTAAQDGAKKEASKWMSQFRTKLAEVFPGDMNARIEIQWRRYSPDLPPTFENFFTVKVISETLEESYQALGRIHIAFHAIPGALNDNISNPRQNGYRALNTRVSHRGRIVHFYITNRPADRFNRIGLLSMDIDSPTFNLQYLDELQEFLQNDDASMQNILSFHRPDVFQVTSPHGDVFSLEEGATALDFAFAVHDQLGLRATGAKINDEPAHLSAELQLGDRVLIEADEGPACDERYLNWATTRKALTALRRHFRRESKKRAATTGRQWYMEEAQSRSLDPSEAEHLVEEYAVASKRTADSIFRDICMGQIDFDDILPDVRSSKRRPMDALVRAFSTKQAPRKVRRYDFADHHIRFCPVCMPLIGDEIEGAHSEGSLNVHRRQCQLRDPASPIPLVWNRSKQSDLRDPGPVEMEIEVTQAAGVLYAIMGPFKKWGLDPQALTMPGEDRILRLTFHPGTARTLDRLIQALRPVSTVSSIRLKRADPNQPYQLYQARET
jgi:GTP pyrophosphokinase